MSKDGKQTELDSTNLPTLPKGWCWTALETVAAIEGGITKDQKRPCLPTMREVPYLRVANVQRGFLDLVEMKTILAEDKEIQYLRLQKGDILFTEGGDRDKLGRGWVWNCEIDECIHQNHIFRARPCLALIDPKFVSYHGNYFGQKWFVKTGKQTTNLASINKGVLRRFPVPIAPRAEQHRIVAKIEELFSDLDAGVAALERVKAKLKRYRAAVLKAAVEGKLTEQWRAKHPPTETAAQLLERILKERRRKWESEQLATCEKAGKKPPANWKEKYKEPAGPDDTNLPALPEGWCWASLEQLSDETRSITYGVVKLGKPCESGVPTLRSSNVRSLRLELDGVKSISPAIANQYSRTFLRGGEVLVTVRGTLGGIVVAPQSCSGFNISREVAMVALTKKELGPALALFLASPPVQNWITTHTRGIAYTGINIQTLKEMPLPLAPEHEHVQIVTEVERRLSLLEEAESQINADLKRSTRLRQSILKRAFEGKLVPQDPKDEPASMLLDRIRVRHKMNHDKADLRPRGRRSK